MANKINFFFLHLKLYYKKLKTGFFIKKLESFLIVFSILALFAYGKYSLIFVLLGASFIYWSFATGPQISFIESLILPYKRAILNRKYIRIKRFWKYDFKKSYKTVQLGELFWQVPFIGTISFYNALSTRYGFVGTIIIIRCLLIAIILEDIRGCFLLLAYFLPLIVITFLCALPGVITSLSTNYGKYTIKKLGFNGLIDYLFTNLGKAGTGTAVILAGSAAAGGFKDWANYQINTVELDRQVTHDNAETQRVKEHNTSNQDNPRPYPKPVDEKAVISRDHFQLSDKNRKVLEKVVGVDSEDNKKDDKNK